MNNLNLKVIPKIIKKLPLVDVYNCDGIRGTNPLTMNTKGWKDKCIKEGLFYERKIIESQNKDLESNYNLTFSYNERLNALEKIYSSL